MAGYLIDSHIFFWAIDAPERLLASERQLLDEAGVEIAVSVVSFWELSIKIAKGQLPLNGRNPPVEHDYFAKHARAASFTILSVDPPEAEYVRQMPSLHRDPFDRMLIAQSILGNRIVITRDAIFARYPGVRVFAP